MLRSVTRSLFRTRPTQAYSTRALSHPAPFARDPWTYVDEMESYTLDDRHGQQGQSKRGQASRGRGGGKSTDKRARRRDDDPRVLMSKSMSSVLRHNADKFGLKMRPDGYAKVQDLLSLPKFRGQTFESIKAVVDADEKRRYNLLEEDGSWFIRANQGHSMTTVKVEMEEIEDPTRVPMVVHGTTQHAWKSISTQGLSRLNRQHIHFAQRMPNDQGVISGARKSSSVLIFIDLAKALRAGYKFYVSENGVVLTPGNEHGFLAPEFFSRVEATRTGQPIDGCNGPRQPVSGTTSEEARPTAGKTITATENVDKDEDREAAEEAWAAIAGKQDSQNQQ